MKNLLTVALLFGSLTAFSQKSIDGTWKGTRETPNGNFEVTYTFKAEGKVLTGTWKTQFGETTLQNEKLMGRAFHIPFPSMTEPSNIPEKSSAMTKSNSKMKWVK